MKLFNRQGRTLLPATVAAILAVCLLGCGGGNKPSGLVGQWIFADGYQYSKIERVELFSDGTGVVDGGSVTWKVENKRLVILSSSLGIAADYKLSGYEVVLTYDDGKSATFVKNGKLLEYRNKKFEKISSYFTDSRNAQKYRTVRIGGKTWMAQNLNYQTNNSWCYDNDNSNCETYGRLYDWNTARTVCPVGWHLPSFAEWNDLVAAAGGDVAGKALKSTYGWYIFGMFSKEVGGIGTDEFGFSALPGGFSWSSGGFNRKERLGFWWSGSESSNKAAYCIDMESDYNHVGLYRGQDKGDRLSVRCVKDETAGVAQKGSMEEERIKKPEKRIEKMSSYFTDSRNGQKYRAVKIGGKTWMAQNLNYQTADSWCLGEGGRVVVGWDSAGEVFKTLSSSEVQTNCNKYGRLYTWDAAKTACPNGWHLPSNQELTDLKTSAGGNVAGKVLKSARGWDENGNGTDDFGFSALPGGRRNDFAAGQYEWAGSLGSWWAAENSGDNAHFWSINGDDDDVGMSYSFKSQGFSVRCVQYTAADKDKLDKEKDLADKLFRND